jgi:hypothetical protein
MEIPDMNDAPATPDPAADNTPVVPVETLTRAQVFARDPESLTETDRAFAISELRKILERQRKAREDDASVAEAASKIKKANAANKKKSKVAVNILETKL